IKYFAKLKTSFFYLSNICIRSPYPSCCISSKAINLKEFPLIQYLIPPSSLGPSSNTCPKWESPILLFTSVLSLPKQLSSLCLITLSSIGLVKLGHPHPASYLSCVYI